MKTGAIGVRLRLTAWKVSEMYFTSEYCMMFSIEAETHRTSRSVLLPAGTSQYIAFGMFLFTVIMVAIVANRDRMKSSSSGFVIFGFLFIIILWCTYLCFDNFDSKSFKVQIVIMAACFKIILLELTN